MPHSSHSALASARSLLFVPGTRLERFEKAVACGADAIVLDLEDAVALPEKAAARQAIADRAAQLAAAPLPVVVRINALGTPEGEQDLQWLHSSGYHGAVMVPKAEDGDAIAALHAQLPDAALLALIETAQGLHALDRVAAAPGVLRLAVGHIDFLADTGMQCSEGEPELAPLRFAVGIATRVHGLAPAIDGVTADFQNDELLRQDTLRALRYGFGGKLCIHPRQVPVVHTAVHPSEAELAWAQRVIEADAASRGAAVRLDGKMIDLPVVLQARRVLARAPGHA